jgi:hypothetical protein
LRLPALPFRIRPLVDLIAFGLKGGVPRIMLLFRGVERVLRFGDPADRCSFSFALATSSRRCAS